MGRPKARCLIDGGGGDAARAFGAHVETRKKKNGPQRVITTQSAEERRSVASAAALRRCRVPCAATDVRGLPRARVARRALQGDVNCYLSGYKFYFVRIREFAVFSGGGKERKGKGPLATDLNRRDLDCHPNLRPRFLYWPSRQIFCFCITAAYV